MPALTRRRDLDAQDECWHVYYGDVRVGTIAKRIGIPPGEDPWGWACGFYPGCHPREQAHGTAATFDQARAEFEEAWRVFLSHRTEGDFQEWRTHRAFTAWKYRMWATAADAVHGWPVNVRLRRRRDDRQRARSRPLGTRRNGLTEFVGEAARHVVRTTHVGPYQAAGANPRHQ